MIKLIADYFNHKTVFVIPEAWEHAQTFIDAFVARHRTGATVTILRGI